MLFLALQSVADGFIVGRLISATALAAVNIVTPVYALVTAVAVIIGVGTQAQMGIHMGSGNYTRAKVALHSGILGVAAFVIPATIFVNVYADEIVVFLGANEELLPMSKAYIHGVMPLLFGVGGFLFCDYQLKALGHPRFAMIIMVLTILLNIVLGVVFVMMGMGTFGVGLGLGLSFTIGCSLPAQLYGGKYVIHPTCMRRKALSPAICFGASLTTAHRRGWRKCPLPSPCSCSTAP